MTWVTCPHTCECEGPWRVVYEPLPNVVLTKPVDSKPFALFIAADAAAKGWKRVAIQHLVNDPEVKA